MGNVFKGNPKMRVSTAYELTKLDKSINIKVARIVILRQRPGIANGVTFLSLERCDR